MAHAKEEAPLVSTVKKDVALAITWTEAKIKDPDIPDTRSQARFKAVLWPSVPKDVHIRNSATANSP